MRNKLEIDFSRS